VPERLIVVTQIGGAFFLWLLKLDRARADRDAIAVLQRVLELLFAVDEDFVRAAMNLAVDVNAVDDYEGSIVGRAYVRVMSRGPGIVQDNLVVRRAADVASDFRDQSVLRLATACVCDLQKRHPCRTRYCREAKPILQANTRQS
jgi:hypothetical protein